MRELTRHKVNGCNNGIDIHVLDEPGAGGACHRYRMSYYIGTLNECSQEVRFQNGPIPEVGTNGITNECLLAILIDRLEGFQSGKFACDANAVALVQLRAALACLKARTAERMARGVEGTHEV